MASNHRPLPSNQRMPRFLPRSGTTADGQHKAWLYVLGTTDGLVKVGKSASPSRRLVQHQSALGERIAWFHLGPGFASSMAYGAEHEAIAYLAKAGERIGHSEWFRGIERSQGIAAIRFSVCAHVTALAALKAARTANAPRKADRHRCATG